MKTPCALKASSAHRCLKQISQHSLTCRAFSHARTAHGDANARIALRICACLMRITPARRCACARAAFSVSARSKMRQHEISMAAASRNKQHQAAWRQRSGEAISSIIAAACDAKIKSRQRKLIVGVINHQQKRNGIASVCQQSSNMRRHQ